MSWIIARAVKLGLLISIGVGIAAFASPGLRTVLLDAYLVALGGVLLLALVRTTLAKAPAVKGSEFDRALAAMRRSRPDADELELARDLELSRLNAFHLHLRVRPLLREIAAHRLMKSYGIDLDTEPGRARELVGASAWEVVRPDRPPPRDRLAPGPPLSSLREVVADLERV
jgi:hypothetical protein